MLIGGLITELGMETVTIIGIGSPVVGDTVGMEAVKWLQPSASVQPRVMSVKWMIRERPGLSLIEDWKGADTVVLIDALAAGEGGTEVRRIAADELLEQSAGFSSHDIGVAETLAMAHQLELLPPRLLIYGIGAACIEETEHWFSVLAGMLSEDLGGVVSFDC